MTIVMVRVRADGDFVGPCAHEPGGRMGGSQETSQITQVLLRLGQGDADAASRLLPLVYEELRALAGSYFRRQRPDHTLQPTALVHEAFVRLIDQTAVAWNDRTHFFALAATAMRQILTDHARRHLAAKRGGGWNRVTLDVAATSDEQANLDLVALDDAMKKLSELDERKHRIVELRFFGGLTVEEVASVLDVSKTTVESDWRSARAWLSFELSRVEGQ